MYNNYNPFKANRTEQMRDLRDYYVPIEGLDESGKPLIIEGGRGSGKTMLFQCNSWREMLSEYRKNKFSSKALIENKNFIGIYYRVDTTFVSAMRDSVDTDWGPVFQTYLSICILQELIDLIIEFNQDSIISDCDSDLFIQRFSKRFNPHTEVRTLFEFKYESDSYLDSIENKLNGLNDETDIDLRMLSTYRCVFDMCSFINTCLKTNLTFKIFIDEYETLQIYQQRIVNTLIKHSTLPVIFNIGLRPHGMKTKKTVSETETIEAPHDYETLSLNIDPKQYQEVLKGICKKRIEIGIAQGKLPKDASTDIEYYLGTYSFETELEQLGKRGKDLPHIKELSKIIIEQSLAEGLSTQDAEEYCNTLCINAPLINSRLHYALLCKKTSFSPTLHDIYKAYTNNTTRYTDWMHNRKMGLLFLLCKESAKNKMYYGFDVYSALSSYTVRYFLELCEQAFRIAFLTNFSWKREISPEEQTRAAMHVSEYKITDIVSYEPYGKELRIFVQYLGKIFYKLHVSPLNTVGEPEPNHFNTKDLSLKDHEKNIIASAIMWNVLQKGEPTKRKQSKLSPETVDYYLNKIYTPYFEISYRNQRKIQLDVLTLEQLLSGNEILAKAAFSAFFKDQKSSTNEELAPNDAAEQITFDQMADGGIS